MKACLIAAGILVVALAQGVAAQPDPYGEIDTVALTFSGEKIPGFPDVYLNVNVWVYSDELLSGASMGLVWDNPKLQLESAYGSDLTVSAFDLGPYYFENNDRTISNQNRRFLFGGVALGTSGIAPDVSGRRLWATYVFRLSNWTASDSVTFDTLTYSDGSQWMLSYEDGSPIFPAWGGPYKIGLADSDGDGAIDVSDNCPSVPNPDQADPEHDRFGSACDNCPTVYNPGQQDADGDLWGDVCDNCPDVSNPSQTDSDSDGRGDDCDAGQVAFTGSPRCGGVPLSVTFQDLSIEIGTIVSWNWDFGDGSGSTDENPVHEFTEANRQYDIRLIISNGVSADTLVMAEYITTQDGLEADFSGLPATGRTPLTVMFEPNLQGVANFYQWDFGDGQSSTQPNPIHTYMNQGKYDVTLITHFMQDGCDQTDTVVKPGYVVVQDLRAGFEASPSIGVSPLLVQFLDVSDGNPNEWLWDFGDGATSTEQNPSHLYVSEGIFDVKLTVRNALGEDSWFQLACVSVLAPQIDLETDIAKRGWVQFRPGFDWELVVFWGNLGTNPADGSVLKVLLPEELQFQQILWWYAMTGTYTGYTLQGDTMVFPLQTIEASYWCGGVVSLWGYIPETVPIGTTMIVKAWISTVDDEVEYANNYREYDLEVIGSWDPNDKLAEPGGKSLAYEIDEDQRIYYTVQFENKKEATAEAIYVRVVDTLDPDLDWGTLVFGDESHPEPCEVTFDPYKGIITWFCDSIMLPPNVVAPEGEGYFTYSIKPLGGLPAGTDIANTAWIRFDYNPWLMAPEDGPIVRTIKARYICGDVNGSGGNPNVSDVTYLVGYIFRGGPAPPAPAAADVNSSGTLNVSDITFLVSFLFRGGPQPNCIQ